MKEKTVSVSFMLMGILFCVCLISANLLATKQIMFGPFNITAGILVFPISYIVNDCIVEVWGFNKAKFLIWTGFLMTLYEVVILPVTIRVVRWVKRVEGVDVYDKNISYNILKVSQL